MAPAAGKAEHAFVPARADSEAERIALTERLNARQQMIDDLTPRIQETHAAQARPGGRVGVAGRSAQLATTLEQERKQAEEKLAIVNEAQRKLGRRLQGPGRRSPEEQ